MPDGSATIIAGTDGQPGSTDGIGTAAQFSTPDDVAVDNAGNIYVADTGNDLLRKITFDGTNYSVRTMAGVAGAEGAVDGSDSSARFDWPTGITVDNAGTVYTAEVKTDRIRAAVYNGPTNGINIWTNTVNGKWEDGLNWSIGYPTIEDEAEYITNGLSKAVVIDSSTVSSRPDSLSVYNVRVSAPEGNVNGLALYNSTLSAPLRIKQQLAIDSGGVVAITNGAIQIGTGLTVGFDAGSGALNVYNGGRVTSTASYVGYYADLSAVDVSGLNSLFTNQNFLNIGYNGDNNGLLIENGGSVGSGNASVGQNGNNNSIVVTGAGSVWRNPGTFIIGDTGGGGNSLTILNGGAVYTGSGGLQIGNGGDGNVVTVSDAGSLLSCSGPLVLTEPVQSTDNALYIGTGATVATPSLVISQGNFVGLAGGTLSTASTDVDNGVVFPVGVGQQKATLHLNGGDHSFANGLEVTDQGYVTGCGTIYGPVTIDVGGTIVADSGCSITFNDVVTNNGTIIPSDGTNVVFMGGLVNHGSVLTNAPAPPPACATVTNGNIVNLADSAMYTITVGTNSVQFYWSLAGPGRSGYLYGTSTTEIALATSVTNIEQITNASMFTFQTSALGPITDGDSTGIGQFTILRNKTTHCYAVVRWDDVQSSSINATWWLQNKTGASDFSCGSGAGASGPVAVSNLVAQVSSGNLGLNFTTQSQRAYTIQVRTNLTTGYWTSLTNFPGDGSSRALSLPIDGPQGYYRVLTQ